MFLVSLTYVEPLEQIEALLPAHGAFLEKYYAASVFIVSGRKVPRTGGIILATAPSKDALMAILAEDPFHQAKVAHYEVTEFSPTKWDPRFTSFT